MSRKECAINTSRIAMPRSPSSAGIRVEEFTSWAPASATEVGGTTGRSPTATAFEGTIQEVQEAMVLKISRIIAVEQTLLGDWVNEETQD